ncbi:MAG: hypothetical protein ACTTGJ_00505 [Clostridium sp.]
MKKEKKGITLIALVLTIIVLLILAAVAISLALGQNGLLSKSRTAQAEQIKAEIKDLVSTEEAAARAKWETDADKSLTTEEKYIEKEIETAVSKRYTSNEAGENGKMEFQKAGNDDTKVKYEVKKDNTTNIVSVTLK